MVSEVVIIVQGPLFGTLFSMLFYGILTMQIFSYVRNYPHDRLILKTAVAAVWTLETIHTGFSIAAIEYYLITKFDDTAALLNIVWSIEVTLILGFVIAYLVNLCFVWRIYILSRSFPITLFLALCSTVRVVIGIYNCSMSFKYIQWKSFRQHVFPTLIAGWTISVFVDAAIAVAICYYLHTQRTGVQRTDTIITRLLVYTINTGAMTSLLAVLVIITFTTIMADAFIAFVQVQSKFYAISLLATLTSRKAILSGSGPMLATFDNFDAPYTLKVTTFSSGSAPSYQLQHIRQMAQGPVIEIKQDRETYRSTDPSLHNPRDSDHSFREDVSV